MASYLFACNIVPRRLFRKSLRSNVSENTVTGSGCLSSDRIPVRVGISVSCANALGWIEIGSK